MTVQGCELLGNCGALTKYTTMMGSTAANLGILFFLGDLGLKFWQYGSGEITGEQLVRGCVLSTTKTVASIVGGALGMLNGSVLGTIAGLCLGFPLVGSSAGLVLTEFVGGLIGGLIATKLTNEKIDELFNKYCKDSEEKVKQDSIAKAFSYFHFNKEDIDMFYVNKEKSAKKLRQRYKHFSKLYHPDRQDGSHKEFLELTMHYGILKGLLKCDLSDQSIDDFVSDVMQTARGAIEC